MSSSKSTDFIMSNNSTQMRKGDESALVPYTSLFGGKADAQDTDTPDGNNLTTDDIFRLADLHFYKKNYIFRHLPDSYNKFIEEDVKNYLEYEEHVFTEVMTETTGYRYRFKFNNIRIQSPMLGNNVEPLFPSMARHQSLTYSIKIFADVTQYQDATDIASDSKKTIVIGIPEKDQLVAIIPLMVRSKWCSLTIHKDMDKNECDFDPGCYFIVKGGEKVVICQDRIVDNKATVFVKKDTGPYVQVHSKSYRANGNTQIVSVRFWKDNGMIVRVPIIFDVNVMILLKALGLESDKSIIDYITYNSNDTDMVELIRNSLNACKTEKGVKIATQEDAQDFLISKIKIIRKYNEKDKETKHAQKKEFLKTILKNNLLPHINGGLIKKAYYLGYMINRLLNVYLKRTKPDDRDSYVNKRIDLVGDLMFELYRQQHKKMMGECKRFFDSRNKNNTTPINIINNIKPNLIETGINGALATGRWMRRQGVAQILQRLSYLYTISLLRRIDAPSGDESTSKLTTPRHLHPSSIGMLCCLYPDTEILQGDNASVKQIKDMKDGDTIISVCKDKLEEISTPIKNYFSKISNNTLKIKTITGRELKCTDDHPLLVKRENKFEMVDAGKLKIGDLVTIRSYEKYLSLDKEMNFVIPSESVKSKKHLKELKTLDFVDKAIQQDKLEILARLFGACITDGNMGCTSPNCITIRFFLGEETDAQEIREDIIRLGFGSSSISRSESTHIDHKTGKQTIQKTWAVRKGGSFPYLMQLLGCFVGNKVKLIKKIPDWILNGNNRVKREFLSGFSGGDGARISVNNNRGRKKIAMNEVYQTTINEHINEMNEYMNSIVKLFTDFDIKCEIRSLKIKGEEEKTKIGYRIFNTPENLQKFSELIGYRYCQEKKRESAPVIEYIRYKMNIMREKEMLYSKIIEYHKQELTMPKIAETVGCTYYTVECVLKKFKKGRTWQIKLNHNYHDFLSYQDFVDKYYIKDMLLAIPIESIEKLESATVYDFTTVADTHTLIANGFVTSNCIETPEHAKIGLTKHLALISSISIMSREQYILIQDYLLKSKMILKIEDVVPEKLRNYNMYKVFFNGDWIGLTEKYIELSNEMEKMKMNGFFDMKNTSIVRDDDFGEIRIYCDSGRIYRPVLKVENNVVNLKRSQINQISFDQNSKSNNKIFSWEDFLIKYPNAIEYIDMELQPYVMIAYKIKKVEEMRRRMVDSIDKVKHVKSGMITNRYDDMTYVKYNYCEIHPSLLIGEIMVNVPFCNRNAGARNIFQYAQGKVIARKPLNYAE